MSSASLIENDLPSSRKSESRHGLIGVIHVRTTTVQFAIYTTPNFMELYTVSEEIQLLMPRDGWFEQDATEIMEAIYVCCAEACSDLPSKGYQCEDILCIGITNQRETTVMWNSKTGKPLYRAIVWNDIRSAGIVDQLSVKLGPEKLKLLQTLTGLRLSPYFSALKIKWLEENVGEVKSALRSGDCKAGTLDSWIIWNLTKGALHVTDVTNASRTMLMNLQTLNWDSSLLNIFKINENILPKICSCSEIFGRIKTSRISLKEVFICGVIGNQQAALVGQSCLDRGQTNCTFDSGCFVLYNTGPQCVYSSSGLLTTVAYKMGPNACPVYALEGSVAVGGRVFDWLTFKMRILPHSDEAEKYALAVNTSAGVYFVPAFTGLYAPYWANDARGTIVGLNGFHNAKHIVRAAHEAICYQVRDILECIRLDSGLSLSKLRASGRLCANKTLMQLQADIAGVRLSVSMRNDRVTLGAAYCAAHAYSVDLSAVAASKEQYNAPFYEEFGPATSLQDRNIGYQKWQRAVKRSMGWAKVKRGRKFVFSWTWILLAVFVLLVAMGIYFVLNHKRIHIFVHRDELKEITAQAANNRKRVRRIRRPFTL